MTAPTISKRHPRPGTESPARVKVDTRCVLGDGENVENGPDTTQRRADDGCIEPVGPHAERAAARSDTAAVETDRLNHDRRLAAGASDARAKSCRHGGAPAGRGCGHWYGIRYGVQKSDHHARRGTARPGPCPCPCRKSCEHLRFRAACGRRSTGRCRRLGRAAGSGARRDRRATLGRRAEMGRRCVGPS